MKRKIILIFAVLCSLQLRVNAQSTEAGNAVYTAVIDDDGLLRPMQPAYLDGVITSPPWNGNWFVTFSGGASAFLGTPLGCNDLFGRIRPVYNVAVGKWFTPAIGTRLDYQGMWLRNSESARELSLCSRRSYVESARKEVWQVGAGALESLAAARCRAAPRCHTR